MAMAKIYAIWVKKHGFDIERVPKRWRAQVEKILAESDVS